MIHPDTKNYIIRLAFTERFISSKQLWRGLIIRWELWLDGIKGNEIPGFTACPPDCGKGYPRGLSLKSVTKLIKETKLIHEHGTAAIKPGKLKIEVIATDSGMTAKEIAAEVAAWDIDGKSRTFYCSAEVWRELNASYKNVVARLYRLVGVSVALH